MNTSSPGCIVCLAQPFSKFREPTEVEEINDNFVPQSTAQDCLLR